MQRFPKHLAFALAIAACRTDDPTGPGPVQPSEGVDNVLIILVDDVGVDKVSSYGMHDDAPPTPHIDTLAAEGVRFTQAWAYPMCSPTRAAMLSGQHPARYGIGNRLLPNVNSWELHPSDIVSLPEVAASVGYTTSFVGKWHLSAGHLGDNASTHPLEHGFDWSEGSLANLVASLLDPTQTRGYTYWEEIRNGEQTWKTTYATTETVDDALARAEAMPEPWLLWVALPSIHTPLHVPPAELYDGPEPVTDIELVDAMTIAMDAEIGRLVDSLDPDLLDRTNIILMGDNGTPSHGIAPPLDPTWDKGTVYEGGVRVPLVVRGPVVAEPGSVSDALTHVVDVLPTVAEWMKADVNVLDLDGQSWGPALADPTDPGADQLFVQAYSHNGPGPHTRGSAAARDEAFKYIANLSGEEELRRVAPDTMVDGPNLLEDPGALTADEQEAWERLSAFLRSEQERVGTWSDR